METQSRYGEFEQWLRDIFPTIKLDDLSDYQFEDIVSEYWIAFVEQKNGVDRYEEDYTECSYL